MGIKKMFRTKPEEEPTAEQNRDELMTMGISVRPDKQRKEKFSAFKEYARSKNDKRDELKPKILDPQRPATDAGANFNPYANLNHDSASYNDLNERPNGPRSTPNSGNPYSSTQHAHSDSEFNGRPSSASPYASANPYALDRTPTAQSQRQDRYDPQQYQSQLLLDNVSVRTMGTDLNEMPRYSQNQAALYEEEEDLNLLPEQLQEDELDLTLEELEQLRLQKEEDEEVNRIKQDIRFTKQQSVLSTRNTLRMAEELYASGQNSLGMLGSQSERLYGIQRNLLLAEVQTKIADDKTKEMAKLNRSMFAVHASNPFNSKRRLRQQEEKIKQGRMNEKLLQDRQRAELHSSERRVIGGLKDGHGSSTSGDIYNKYNDQKILENAKRYQFENDSEDDDMEREIHQNLNLIGNHAGNLKRMAMTIGLETDSQNKRMNEIEEDADLLDINVHLNNHRLAGMR